MDEAVVGIEQQSLRRKRVANIGQDSAHAPRSYPRASLRWLVIQSCVPGRLEYWHPDRQENSMKQFKCGDVVLGCEWVTRSEDETELLEEIQTHARDAHGMDEVP